jgi:UrcA family protein
MRSPFRSSAPPSSSRRRGIAVFGLAAAVAATLAAGVVAAQERISLTVNIGDLDLSRPAGRRLAAQRIASGARRLCLHLADSRSVAVHETYQDCMHDTVAAAMRQIEAQGPSLASD